MSARERPLPTFLIIGAQKSATRWLRLNLGYHPDVYAADRELEFFNKTERFARGAAWYREQFEDWSDEPIVGEATPGYMFWRERPDVIAGRIHRLVPEVRLLAILRNPVDRAQSAMVHHIKFTGLPPESNLVDLVHERSPESDPLGIVSGGWYAASLEPFHDAFGEQLLVLLHDDCEHEPRRTYERALRHIGAAPNFVPPDLDRVVFSNQKDPSRAPAGVRDLTMEQRRELYEFFADDIEKLEKMIGRDLSIWRPEPVSA
jgi:hypothetical protein